METWRTFWSSSSSKANKSELKKSENWWACFQRNSAANPRAHHWPPANPKQTPNIRAPPDTSQPNFWANSQSPHTSNNKSNQCNSDCACSRNKTHSTKSSKTSRSRKKNTSGTLWKMCIKGKWKKCTNWNSWAIFCENVGSELTVFQFICLFYGLL